MKSVLFGMIASLSLTGIVNAEEAGRSAAPVSAFEVGHYDLQRGLFMDDGRTEFNPNLFSPELLNGGPGGGHGGGHGGGIGGGHGGGHGHGGHYGHGWHPGGGSYHNYPGWHDGWRWRHDYRPGWWYTGVVFPLWYWEEGITRGYWECIAFSEGGQDATPYTGFGPTQDHAAFAALNACGGEDVCYIPPGYCQLR